MRQRKEDEKRERGELMGFGLDSFVCWLSSSVAVVVALALDRSGSRIPRGLGGISLPGSWLISHS